jgi:hypothetical protein
MVEGKKFISEVFDPFTAFHFWCRGDLTVRQWRESVSSPREFAWWSWRDPAPFLAMAVRLPLRVVVRAMRRPVKQAVRLLAAKWQEPSRRLT